MLGPEEADLMTSRGPGLETLFDAALLGLGAVIAYVSWGYGFGNLARPGPGLYPFFLGAAIVVCSVAVIATRAHRTSGGQRLDRRDARILVTMTCTFCLWILAMPVLGYVLVTFITAYAFCKVLALEGWRKPLALSATTAAFVYLLFGHWLYIDLPRGILFE